ncbi:MAG: complex I NDUFA9 subunit family protein [Burkholderiaceae bacterium]
MTQLSKILVIGGTGFIGQAIVTRLAAQHHTVTVPSRRRRAGRELILLPTVDVVQADIHDDSVLQPMIAEADAVINFVGIAHSDSGEPYGSEFKKIHVDLPRRIANACSLGKQRLIHFSALGADPASDALPSEYLRSKADGEKAITQSDCKTWTILRPSVVFGPGDNFLNLFARIQRFAPFMAVGRAGAQLQPIFVGDVASAVSNILDNTATYGKHYELAGPEIYSLGELIQLAGRYSGHERRLIKLSDSMGRLQARLMGAMPGPKLMTSDNFDSLAKPSVATGPMAPELGINPRSLSVVAPQYLGNQVSPYNETRTRARR